MKKILAVLLTIVMAFSLAAPAFAAAPEIDMDGVSASIGQINLDGNNNFHGFGGTFKLIVNNTDTPVKVKITGTNKVGSTILTGSNIGDYIVGPYVVV